MGAQKAIFKGLGRLVGGTISAFTSGLGGDKQQAAPTPAADTAIGDTKEAMEARRKAIAGLTQTSTLGAGKPTTARSKVLGV